MSRRSPTKVALVTGAAGAIGRAVCRALLKEFAVAATDLSPPELRGATWREEMDVRDLGEVRRMRDVLVREARRLDALVYCAGVLRPGGVLTTNEKTWAQTLEVNLLGAARCMQVFGEWMARRREGRIVLVGSLSARAALPGAAAYAASKAALESLGRSAAAELARSNVRVVCVSPGFVRSSLSQAVPPRVGGATPVGRMGTPEEVAEVVSTLLRVDTLYLTGARVDVAGGLSPW